MMRHFLMIWSQTSLSIPPRSSSSSITVQSSTDRTVRVCYRVCPVTLSRVFFSLRRVSAKDPKTLSRDRIDEWKWIPLWLLSRRRNLDTHPEGRYGKLCISTSWSHRNIRHTDGIFLNVGFWGQAEKRTTQKSRSLDRRRSGRDSWARKIDKVNKSIVDGLTWKMNSMTWRIFAALFFGKRFCPLFDKVMRGSWWFRGEEQMHQKIVRSRYVFIYGPEEICKLRWVWWLVLLEGLSGTTTNKMVELVCCQTIEILRSKIKISKWRP